MAWGLDGVQLSNKQQAAYVDGSSGILGWIVDEFFDGFDDWVNDMITKASISPYYDFYLTRDNPYGGITPRDYQGLAFNKEIVTTLLSKYSTDSKAKVNDVLLTEDPVSAIAYCYNKNKRDENGDVCYVSIDGSINTDRLKWHLPSIDEIEDIASGAYDEFDKVFQAEEYWSCQPAYEKNNLDAELRGYAFSFGRLKSEYYNDDLNRARATYVYTEDGGNNWLPCSSEVPGYTTTIGGSMRNSWLGGGVSYDGLTTNKKTYVESDYSKYPGNLPRTQSCRIRAVYRSGKK